MIILAKYSYLPKKINRYYLRSERKQCIALTKTGYRCLNPIAFNGFCHLHDNHGRKPLTKGYSRFDRLEREYRYRYGRVGREINHSTVKKVLGWKTTKKGR